MARLTTLKKSILKKWFCKKVKCWPIAKTAEQQSRFCDFIKKENAENGNSWQNMPSKLPYSVRMISLKYNTWPDVWLSVQMLKWRHLVKRLQNNTSINYGFKRIFTGPQKL